MTSHVGATIADSRMYMFGGHRLWHGFSPENSVGTSRPRAALAEHSHADSVYIDWGLGMGAQITAGASKPRDHWVDTWTICGSTGPIAPWEVQARGTRSYRSSRAIIRRGRCVAPCILT